MSGKDVIWEHSQAIGSATNNIAEYTAVVYALEEALVRKFDNVKVFTDSELLYRQICGIYQVKNPSIKLLFDQVQRLMKGFKKINTRQQKVNECLSNFKLWAYLPFSLSPSAFESTLQHSCGPL